MYEQYKANADSYYNNQISSLYYTVRTLWKEFHVTKCKTTENDGLKSVEFQVNSILWLFFLLIAYFLWESRSNVKTSCSPFAHEERECKLHTCAVKGPRTFENRIPAATAGSNAIANVNRPRFCRTGNTAYYCVQPLNAHRVRAYTCRLFGKSRVRIHVDTRLLRANRIYAVFLAEQKRVSILDHIIISVHVQRTQTTTFSHHVTIRLKP